MALRLSRRTRRTMRNLNSGARDIQGYIEDNPLTSALLAMAAGVVATSVVKMTLAKPAAAPATTRPAAKPARRKKGRKAPARAK